MKWILLGFLIINPMFFVVGAELRPVQELCYQITSLLVILSGCFYANKPIKANKLNISIGFLMLSLMAVWLRNQFGFPILLNAYLGFFVYLTIIRTLEIEDINFILKGLRWFVLFCVVYLLGQYLEFDLRDQLLRGVRRLVGGPRGKTALPHCSIFGIKCAMGVYFAMTAPLLAIVGSFSALALLIPIGLSWSSGAVLGSILGFSFFFWFRKRIVFWCLVVPVVVCGLLFFIKMDNPLGMSTTRFDMWGKVMQDTFQKPLGRGLDSFRNPQIKFVKEQHATRYFKHTFDNNTVRFIRSYRPKDIEMQEGIKNSDMSADSLRQVRDKIANRESVLDWWDHPHNEFLWLGYECGFPALIALGFVFYFLWQRFKRSTRNTMATASMASLISLACCCLTQFPFHLARNGHLVPLILGIFYITTEINDT